jgi:hypothetical protein
VVFVRIDVNEVEALPCRVQREEHNVAMINKVMAERGAIFAKPSGDISQHPGRLISLGGGCTTRSQDGCRGGPTTFSPSCDEAEGAI